MIELFFREEGRSGRAVVILHGLFGSSDNWLTVGKKLATRYHVYLVDQRNHGRSPNNPVHSYEAMKEDLARFFDARGLGEVILIGHSMGGKTAMMFAADYPERIEKLVVADTAPKDYRQMQENGQIDKYHLILESLREFEQQADRFKTKEEIGLFLNLRLNDPGVVRFLLKSIHRDKDRKRFGCRLNIEALESSLDEIVSGVNEEWFADRIPILNYPVLFIKGEDSHYIQEEDLPLIRKVYPEARLERIPLAGHWLHTEQPILFMEALERFI